MSDPRPDDDERGKVMCSASSPVDDVVPSPIADWRTIAGAV